MEQKKTTKRKTNTTKTTKKVVNTKLDETKQDVKEYTKPNINEPNIGNMIEVEYSDVSYRLSSKNLKDVLDNVKNANVELLIGDEDKKKEAIEYCDKFINQVNKNNFQKFIETVYLLSLINTPKFNTNYFNK